MINIKEVQDLKGKRVLLRLDLNVPVENGNVENDFKLIRSFPTIEFLKQKGAKIIIISHIGRNKSDTLFPVFSYLKNKFKIIFVRDILGDEVISVVENMEDGDIILLENLRKYDGEVENDASFTEQIAQLGDIYVNDSFASSHRKHSSIVGLPKFLPSYSGILFDQEVRELSKSFNPPSPSILILGGNKFETKLPLIEKMLDNYDYILVGGALMNNFFKTKGLDIGNSIVSEDEFDLEKIINNEKLILPKDVVVTDGEKVKTKKPNEILENEITKDIGPETVFQVEEIIRTAKFVILNGPLGDYEKGFSKTTKDLLKATSSSNAQSIAGGGDMLKMVYEAGLENNFSFLSTGGGAMLDFLLKETLPGIEALRE